MVKSSVILLSLLLFCFGQNESFAQKGLLKKIIVDAGHGGTDVGARGKYSTEKEISLAVSLQLVKELQQEMPDVEIIPTRTTDIFHSPPTKANIANFNKGDLFVSIHCNAAPPIRHSELVGYKSVVSYTGKGRKKKKRVTKVPQYRSWSTPNDAKGTETYIWGVHKTDQKEAAMRENESLYLDSATANYVKDFDPNSPEKMILYSLKTQQYFGRSANLALTIEQEFVKVGRISRQAQQRQKGIWVLQAVAMPSVLIELGFISNPSEEDYLNSASGQKEIVESIVRAIKKYKLSLGTASNGVTAPTR